MTIGMFHENENETLVGKGGGVRLLGQLSLLSLSSPRAEAKICCWLNLTLDQANLRIPLRFQWENR